MLSFYTIHLSLYSLLSLLRSFFPVSSASFRSCISFVSLCPPLIYLFLSSHLPPPPSSFPYFAETFSSFWSCPCTGVRVRAHACDREGTSRYNTKGRKIGDKRERTSRATRLEIISMLRVEDRTCSRTCRACFRVFDRIFYVCTLYTVHPAAINSYSVAYRRHPIYGDFVGRVI